MRRLNVKLLVALIIASVALTAAVHFLHGYQVDRNAEVFKEAAQRYKNKGDLEEAVKNLSRYMKYRGDDVDAICVYAMWWADLIEQKGDNAHPEHVRRVPLMLEQALRSAPDRDDIRRRLARTNLETGRPRDALVHFNLLLEKPENKEDAELHLLIGTCYEQDKNYDKAKEFYDKAKALAPGDVDIYVQLANLFSGPLEDPQEGDKIMNELVDKNPQNHRVYLMRYNYRLRHLFGERSEAKADLQKALDLAPDEADVLVKMAEMLITDREFDAAREHLNRGIELHPQNVSMYITLAMLELEQGRVTESDRSEAALDALMAGLKQLPESTMLLIQLCELQIRREQFDRANDTIARLVQLDISQEQIDFLKSRVLLGEKKWVEASRLLHSLRKRSSRDNIVLFQIDTLLADCYRNLRQTDLAIHALRRALENNPYSKEVRLRLVRELQSIGRAEEAAQELEKIPGADISVDYESLLIKLSEQLMHPLEQRQWDEVDALLARLEGQPNDPALLASFKVRLLIHKGQIDEALRYAIEQRERFPQTAGLWVTIADIQAQKDLPAAIATLKEAADRLGTPVYVQVALVGKVLRLEREQALAELQQVNKTVESYTPEEQRQLAQSLSEAFYILKEVDAAKDVLNRVAERLPNDPTLRLIMFELARDARDPQGMTDALAGIERVVGRDHNYWQYCEAARLSTLFFLKKASDSDLEEARKLVEKVIETRPTWTAILRLSAEIDDLAGRSDDAIKKYEQALNLGESSIGMIRRLVELLYKAGRYNEASQALSRLPAELQFSDEFGKLTAELQMKVGQADLASKQASNIIDEDSTEFRDHLWQGQLFARAGRRDEAEASYRRAVDHGPEEPACWVALVSQLVHNGKRDEAQAKLADMQAALDASQLPTALAQCHEVFGDFEKASAAYDEAVAVHAEDTTILRSAIEFYLRSQQPAKAQVILDKLVALAPQKKEANELEQIRWGRRTLGALAAASNSYEDLRRALVLIDGNADANRNLSNEDILIKANLLSARDDLRSRREAIRLLEGVLAKEPSRANVRFQLAQLYERDGKWTQCRDHMLQLLSGDKPSPVYIPVFANMLLRQDLVDDAARMLEKLEQIDPNAQITLAVKALLYARRGYIDEAISFTRELVVRPIAPSQVQKLLEAAHQFEKLADAIGEKEGRQAFINGAEEMYAEYLRERPTEVFVMAYFQGKHRSIDTGLKICEENFKPENSANVASMSMSILRANRGKANQDQIARVEKMLIQASEQHPELVALSLELAELRELQGNFNEAAKLYRQVIDSDKAPLPQKAAAKNNLAYLLAVHDNNGTEALPLVEQAIAYFGPTAELLDTRGVIYTTRKDYEHAIRDLSEAVEDRANGLKYFHLAWAHHLAGNAEGAAQAMQQADASGLKNEDISPLERERLLKLRSEI